MEEMYFLIELSGRFRSDDQGSPITANHGQNVRSSPIFGHGRIRNVLLLFHCSFYINQMFSCYFIVRFILTNASKALLENDLCLILKYPITD